MSRAQAETVIKNIIREIAQDCASRGSAVSETLVAFMVKAVVLDPDNEFHIDRTLTKDDVQKLIKLCVDRLLETQSPSLETVKMQVYFDMNYTSRAEFLSEHKRVLTQRMQPVVREITDSRSKTKDDIESLYRKIVSAVLLKSGLGSPTDLGVVREATAALQSIFPHMELGTFMGLNKKDKEKQLQELTLIVTGIRLFNKDCGKGGEGIDDLPSILNEAIPATSDNLTNELDRVCNICDRLTALIEKQVVLAQDPNEADFPLDLCKDAAENLRQYIHFNRVLLTDIISCAKQVEYLQTELGARLDHLHATVQSKTAVPTAQVYPQFVHLAQVWSGFQDEIVLLSVLSNIFASLQPFVKVAEQLFPDEILLTHLEDVRVATDEERLAQSGDEQINPNDFRAERFQWIFPETTKNFDRLSIMYKGYCAWAFAEFDRLLIPANPKIGLLRDGKFHYAFHNKDAAYNFCENKDEYIQRIGNMAKKHPQLIQLLEMHQQFAELMPYSKSKSGLIEKPKSTADVDCQTDTHILEPTVVKDYEWNEWELRRKALKLANLRRKVTHSMQTDYSNRRRDNITQVYLPKTAGTQTKRDNWSSVPNPKTFYSHLRGMPLGQPTRPVKVDLTIDPDDQLFLNDTYYEPHEEDEDREVERLRDDISDVSLIK